MKKSFMIAAFESAGIVPWTLHIDYLVRAKISGARDSDAIDRYLGAFNPKKLRTPEEICAEVGIPPRVIVGHIAAQIWDIAHSEAGMLMGLHHVSIVKASIETAKIQGPDGFRDRDALLKANGVIPIPKTQTIHLHKHISSPRTIEGETHELPDFEDDLEEAGEDRLPPLLPAPESKE